MASKTWKLRNPDKYRIYRRAMQNRRAERVTAWLLTHKQANPCACGESDVACLEFHHRESGGKEFGIGSRSGITLTKIQREVAKCEVLCANCHRKGHAGRAHALHAAFFAEGIDWHGQ